MFRAIAAITLIYLAVLLPEIITALKYHATVVDIKIYDYSFYSFIGITIAVITMCLRYKNTNDYYSVFPQTSTSRFLSSQIILYLWLALISVTSLVLYLFQLCVFKLLSKLNSNILFAFQIDAGMTFTGMLVFFVYGCLMIAFLSLIAVLIRRFNTIAVVVILLIAALLLTSEKGLFKAIADSLAFFNREGSLALFFLKGIITWLLLLAASMGINKYTSYYKTQRVYKNSIVAAVGIVALIIISIIRSTVIEKDGPVVVYGSYRTNNNFYNNDVWVDKEITLDASEFANLNEISVVSSFEISDNMYLGYTFETLPYSEADNIIVTYRLPVYLTNNYDLTGVTNPKFTAKLNGNVLSLTYTYDKNRKVLFLSPWFMMRQFDRYKDKNLYSDYPDFNTTNSRSTGIVNVSVE
jgi:hypothetical protein